MFAADTDAYMDPEDRYNEIFIATIPEGWQAGKGNFDDFADKMEVARTKIDLLIIDIVLNHNRDDLDHKRITWMINKGHLEENLIYWFESNGYLPNSGTLSHEPTSFDIDDANPSVKLPPKAKVKPQATSRLRRQNPIAKADTASSARSSQVAQYVASHTEDSDAAPSPTSAGATNTHVEPLGKCNFDKPPHPIMFDERVHESSQMYQLETRVLTRHGVSLWRDLSVSTPICPSGHALNPMQLLEFVNDPQSGTACCCCSTRIGVNGLAFTCFRCVASYYLTLSIDKEVVSAGLSKGALYCADCAFRTARETVQFAPASQRS